MKYYILFAFLFCCLTYLLFFGWTVLCLHPLQSSAVFDACVYGFIIHTPLWMVMVLVSGLFKQRVLGMEKLDQIIKTALFAIVAFFVVTIFYEDLNSYFNRFFLAFYTFDFIFCYLLFLKLVQKRKGKKNTHKT